MAEKDDAKIRELSLRYIRYTVRTIFGKQHVLHTQLMLSSVDSTLYSVDSTYCFRQTARVTYTVRAIFGRQHVIFGKQLCTYHFRQTARFTYAVHAIFGRQYTCAIFSRQIA